VPLLKTGTLHAFDVGGGLQGDRHSPRLCHSNVKSRVFTGLAPGASGGRDP
jgi:hypothetical protein